MELLRKAFSVVNNNALSDLGYHVLANQKAFSIVKNNALRAPGYTVLVNQNSPKWFRRRSDVGTKWWVGTEHRRHPKTSPKVDLLKDRC